MGCPIELVCRKGGGAALQKRRKKVQEIVFHGLRRLNCPLTIKMRTGWDETPKLAHTMAGYVPVWKSKFTACSPSTRCLLDGVDPEPLVDFHTGIYSTGRISTVLRACPASSCTAGRGRRATRRRRTGPTSTWSRSAKMRVYLLYL
jgi:hypothetical protein